MERMYSIPEKKIVFVAWCDPKNMTAVIFDEKQAREASKTHNGWKSVTMKGLIPLEFINIETQDIGDPYDIGRKVKLIEALYECKDGLRFYNWNEAVKHQEALDNGEPPSEDVEYPFTD